jgi:UDP-3-O-[3-hydroxymyristoyl] glucosamine N-acyltransferase
MKSYTLGEIAKLLDVQLIGDDQVVINGLGTLRDAAPQQLSFLSNPAYIDQLSSCKASAVIIAENFSDICPTNKLISSAPYVSFAKASALFDRAPSPVSGIHPTAIVDNSAKLAKGVSVAANSVIGADVCIGENSEIGAGVTIGAGSALGKNCKLHSSVTLYHKVSLGSNVIIHSGSIVGADGFGFAFDGEKSIKIHQLGSVRIADNVEIGAGTTIDRGAIEDTVIGLGVKIDNQVQIGHNCIIGDHTIICGCTAIAGSVKIGRYCIMGGASGAVGHISIADKVQVSAMSLVSSSITEAGMYSSGTGHMKTSIWKRLIVRFQQLDSIAKRLKELEKPTDKE